MMKVYILEPYMHEKRWQKYFSINLSNRVGSRRKQEEIAPDTCKLYWLVENLLWICSRVNPMLLHFYVWFLLVLFFSSFAFTSHKNQCIICFKLFWICFCSINGCMHSKCSVCDESYFHMSMSIHPSLECMNKRWVDTLKRGSKILLALWIIISLSSMIIRRNKW